MSPDPYAYSGRTNPSRRGGPSKCDAPLVQKLCQGPDSPAPEPVGRDVMQMVWDQARIKADRIIAEGPPYPETFHVELRWGTTPPRKYLFAIHYEAPRLGQFMGKVRG